MIQTMLCIEDHKDTTITVDKKHAFQNERPFKNDELWDGRDADDFFEGDMQICIENGENIVDIRIPWSLATIIFEEAERIFKENREDNYWDRKYQAMLAGDEKAGEEFARALMGVDE